MSGKFLLFVSLCIFFSCTERPAKNAGRFGCGAVPEFNSDSAFRYTGDQVSFGPRVPGTASHDSCASYLVRRLAGFGFATTVQRTTVRLFDGTPIGISNIVGSFGTGNANRILLCAHWDSRPYADRDPDPASRGKAIDGANDGAGSCGVLLEIARQVGLCGPSVGVDILFFDAEDWGEVNGDFAAGHYGTWCMGSDYWAGHPHTENYNAAFGILLDMVSGVDARFYREYFSMEYAPHVVDKVWRAARAAGYGRYFPDALGGAIEDDHLPVNRRLGIPCIDIIQYDPGSATGFGDFWHTLDDDMEHVSVETMKAVGQTVLQVIYDEE